MNRSLKVAISPCPNDTYIFGAWILGLIDQDSELGITTEYMDIQLLNEAADAQTYDIIKVSASQVQRLRSKYQILEVGGAMGEDCGPLLVSYIHPSGPPQSNWNIAIPGHNTTASLLLKQLFPDCKTTSQVLFSKIEEALQEGRFDAGVLIHESRFTYSSKGLHLLADLGSLWVKETGLPIPLGVIAINRKLDPALKQKIKTQIRRSLNYAESNLDALLPYIKEHAQEMEEHVLRAHIQLYVNKYSTDLGNEGKKAILTLNQLPTIPNLHTSDLFI